MPSISIREYREQDWAQIEAIHDAARKIELHLAALDDAFVPLAQAAINEDLFDYTVKIALMDDEVVGFTAYTKDELAWLYVSPEHMRQGIGSALIAHVMENTIRPLALEVMVGNDPAIRAYESLGFQTTEICSGKMPGNESFSVSVHCMQLL